MAQRTFDLFNVKVAGTTIAGPTQVGFNQVHPDLPAANDGAPMLAACDRGPATATVGVTCQDIGQFAERLAACEGALVSVQAEGREVGADTVNRITASNLRLINAGLDLVHGSGYGTAKYDFQVSWPSDAVGLEDGIAGLNAQTKTIVVAGAQRAHRIKSATHGAVTIEKVTGLSLAVRGIGVEVLPADDDFGETVEVGGYDVTGTLTFHDLTASGSPVKSIAQQLLAAANAALVIPMIKQGEAVVGGATFTLTIANVKFMKTTTTPVARKYGVESLAFRTEGVIGTTLYNLATGANKIITIA